MEQATVQQFVRRIHAQLGAKCGARANTFEGRVKQAKHLMPRKVKKAALNLVEADAMAVEPALARRLDATQVTKDYSTMVAFLDKVDASKKRSRSRYSLASAISFNILAAAAVAIALLRWRGFI